MALPSEVLALPSNFGVPRPGDEAGGTRYAGGRSVGGGFYAGGAEGAGDGDGGTACGGDRRRGRRDGAPLPWGDIV